mmetsp:Transcript_27303/g.42673  ORF Transcript_27303/g.42673 Transcript_27303/m.42673 type:complete len:166 (-) Transcript_27303:73-570(-)
MKSTGLAWRDGCYDLVYADQQKERERWRKAATGTLRDQDAKAGDSSVKVEQKLMTSSPTRLLSSPEARQALNKEPRSPGRVLSFGGSSSESSEVDDEELMAEQYNEVLPAWHKLKEFSWRLQLEGLEKIGRVLVPWFMVDYASSVSNWLVYDVREGEAMRSLKVL